MSFQELEKLYPNKEIKLIPIEFTEKYISYGYSVLETFEQKSFGKTFQYCFIAII